MADQQDQLSSGGSVKTADASADTSKLRGKSSSGGSSGYRKRQSTGSIPVTVEEKRRRQTIGDPQSSEVFNNTSSYQHSTDSFKAESKTRNERKSHGSGLESYLGNYIRRAASLRFADTNISARRSLFTDTDWRPQHKVQQSSYNISGNSTRVRSATRTSLPELNLTAIDCVASRTRSRTPQNPQAISQGHNSYDLSLSSSYGNREDLTCNNLVSTSSTTPVTSHPSTSRGRG